MELINQLWPKAQFYLDQRDWCDVPMMAGHRFRVEPLAQGEYNLNYRIRALDADLDLVLRVNIGTQINRADQVLYEFQALNLLKDSQVTPFPYFADDSRSLIERGILVMEYLPGAPLDYTQDLDAAAGLFARIHRMEVPAERNHLIREDAPLSLIYAECDDLLQRYFESELADPDIRSYLKEVIAWADQARAREAYYQQDPWPCIVNTEVNSGNFIVNRSKHSIHLVDWEMPRWGDPSQDLSHFCSPLTTLWKTDFRMDLPTKRKFMQTYADRIGDAHLRDTLADRIALRDPFVYLRGISWSAMGWVAYQRQFAGIKNPDTWETIQRYMTLDFIRSIFDDVIFPGL